MCLQLLRHLDGLHRTTNKESLWVQQLLNKTVLQIFKPYCKLQYSSKRISILGLRAGHIEKY